MGSYLTNASLGNQSENEMRKSFPRSKHPKSLVFFFNGNADRRIRDRFFGERIIIIKKRQNQLQNTKKNKRLRTLQDALFASAVSRVTKW